MWLTNVLMITSLSSSIWTNSPGRIIGKSFRPNACRHSDHHLDDLDDDLDYNEKHSQDGDLFDIDFDPANPDNGFIVGNKGTFLQTFDGGKKWQARSFANLDSLSSRTPRLELFNYMSVDQNGLDVNS